MCPIFFWCRTCGINISYLDLTTKSGTLFEFVPLFVNYILHIKTNSQAEINIDFRNSQEYE